MELSQRLKKMRIDANITQHELSKRIYDNYGLKISQGNIGDWERGRSKPSADALIALSKYYGETIDYILTGVKTKNIISLNTLTPEEKYVINKMRLLSPMNIGKLVGYLDCLDTDNIKIEAKK